SSLHRYPDGSGYYLKEKLAGLLGVSSEEIVLGNGSNELIDFLIRVFIRPGYEVISSDPSFLVYCKMVQVVGGSNVVIPLSEYHHDLENISRAVTPKTRLIFLDNPNNPTGTVIHRADFDAFLKNLPDHLLVVLDEAYMEFVRTEQTPKAVEYMKQDRRVVALRTFSKAYGLAGLRVGYGVMDRDVVKYLERVRQPFNVNTMAQVGALAALDDHQHLTQTVDSVWQGMDFLTKKLEELGYRVMSSETNFILIDINRDAKMVYEKMLREGIIVRAMTAYGLPNHIRITVGLPEENLRCVEALQKVLKS
ncbi:MAG: histidinol-phosphate transaminase, partial [Thermodesulfobacteriota bacterium]|nr:histidinol-phosphate transaminase [Thermodesulfobacteriota bacterium]